MYNAVGRGYLNYYSFAHNYNGIVNLVQHILKGSCAKLLAAKFRLKTQKKVYEKFGSDLIFKDPNSGKEYSFMPAVYGTKLKFNTNNLENSEIINSLYSIKSIATLDNLACKNCGSKYRVEMHHVRALKDLNPKLSHFDKLMVQAKRKQIPLCRKCHMILHLRK
jgi:hypothetical protein